MLLPILHAYSAFGHEHFPVHLANRAARVVLAGNTSPAERAATSPAVLKATPFTLSEASLSGASAEHEMQDTNLAYLLMLNVSSLAYNFRNTSHLSLEGGIPFGGWETP